MWYNFTPSRLAPHRRNGDAPCFLWVDGVILHIYIYAQRFHNVMCAVRGRVIKSRQNRAVKCIYCVRARCLLVMRAARCASCVRNSLSIRRRPWRWYMRWCAVLLHGATAPSALQIMKLILYAKCGHVVWCFLCCLLPTFVDLICAFVRYTRN